jgi:hypothetical protein
MTTNLPIIMHFDIDHGEDYFDIGADVEVIYGCDPNTGEVEATNANVRKITGSSSHSPTLKKGDNPEWLTNEMIRSLEKIAVFAFNQNPEKYT